MNVASEHVNLLDELELFAYGQFLDTMVIVDCPRTNGCSESATARPFTFPWLVDKPVDVQRAEQLADRIRSVRG